MSNFDRAFDNVIRLEGGFVNHAADPGGATKLGISLRYLVKRGDLDRDGLPDGDIDGDGDIDVDDIRALQPPDAKHLYHTGFWVPNRLQEIRDQDVANKIFDMCVNMGSRQAWRLVQRACNESISAEERLDELEVDGLVGPITLRAANALPDLLYAIRDRQADFYVSLADARPGLGVFLKGWLNRAAS